MLVKELIEQWLTVAAPQSFKRSSLRVCGSYLRTHLAVGGIGEKEAAKVTIREADAFAAALADAGLSAATRQNIVQLFSRVFEKGIEWEVCSRNPFAKVRVRRAEKLDEDFDNYLNPQDLQKLMGAVWWALEPVGALAIWLAGRLGLRNGEVRALRPQDVTFVDGAKKGTVGARVRVLQHMAEDGEATSTKGNATVTYELDAEEIGPLQEQWKHAKMFNSSTLLHSKRGRPLHAAKVNEWLAEACRCAGVARVSFHGLRHSCGTALAARGASDQLIMKYMRHTSTRMVGRYVHLGGRDVAAAGTLLVSVCPSKGTRTRRS